MPLSPLQKISIYGGSALVVVGLFGAMSFYYASRLVAADRAVERANANMSSALHILASTNDGERAAKAYVVRPDSDALSALQQAQSRVEDALDAMRRPVEDNPHQARLLGALSQQVANVFSDFRQTATIRHRFGADSARRYFVRGVPPFEEDTMMRTVAHMREEELRVLAEQTRLQSLHGANAQRIILIGMALTFLLAGVALQPLRANVAARLTSRIARGYIGTSERVARAHAHSAREQLGALHDAVAALNDARDPAMAARALVEHGVESLAASFAAVFVPNGAGGFTVLASSDARFDAVPLELAQPIADALRTGALGVAVSRAEREQRYGNLAALDTHGARGAVLFVPLRSDAAQGGVLLAARDEDLSFSDDELRFATTLGRLGGPAVVSRSLTS
jgi:CHASE3 domain sensor protein